MKIERIESYRRDDHLLAVHVTTDDGVVGVGQASVFRAGITQRVLHDMVAPMFLGRDPWDLEAIVHATVREHYKFEGSFVTRALCRSEEHTSELQSRENLVCRLLLEKKKTT